MRACHLIYAWPGPWCDIALFPTVLLHYTSFSAKDDGWGGKSGGEEELEGQGEQPHDATNRLPLAKHAEIPSLVDLNWSNLG